MNSFTIFVFYAFMLYSIHSHPLIVSSNLAKLPPSQIDQLCSYVSQLEQQPIDSKTIESASLNKRFAIPFPDMNRFLSTSPKVHHHHHHHQHEPTANIGTELSSKKHDFHAYLCSISKDSDEVSNFIQIYYEETGQAPDFNIFKSCDQINKRDLSTDSDNNYDRSSALQLNELTQLCSNRRQSRFEKRWKYMVDGPMSIDFIHQMLESRKVKSYPYPTNIDPYLVGR